MPVPSLCSHIQVLGLMPLVGDVAHEEGMVELDGADGEAGGVGAVVGEGAPGDFSWGIF